MSVIGSPSREFMERLADAVNNEISPSMSEDAIDTVKKYKKWHEKQMSIWKESFKSLNEKLQTTDVQAEMVVVVEKAAFIAVILKIGDTFIDKLLNAFGIFSQKFHLFLGHSVCIGVGFLLSFFIEFCFLLKKKHNNGFSNDPKENTRIFWDQLKRSFTANLCGGVVSTLTSIAIAAILTSLAITLWPCVIVFIIAIAVGILAKWGVKYWWDRYARSIYKSLAVFQFRIDHQTFTKADLVARMNVKLQSMTTDVSKLVLEKKKNDLEYHSSLLTVYIESRDKKNGYLKTKVEGYIEKMESNSNNCLIM